MSKKHSNHSKNFKIWKNTENITKQNAIYHLFCGELEYQNNFVNFFYKDKFYCCFNTQITSSTKISDRIIFTNSLDFVHFEFNFFKSIFVYPFENHQITLISAIVTKSKICFLYLASRKNEDETLTMSIVKCNYDLENNQFINKEILLVDFQLYELLTNFHDASLFEFENQYFLIISGKNKSQKNVFLIFKLDEKLTNPIYVKEIILNLNAEFITKPNLIFLNKWCFFIFTINNQTKKMSLYGKVESKAFWDFGNFSCELSQFIKIDYSDQFMDIKTFKIDKDWYSIALISFNNQNVNLSWFNRTKNVFSMVKKIVIDKKDNLNFIENENYKIFFKNANHEFVKYFDLFLAENETIEILDENQSVLTLSVKDKYLNITNHLTNFKSLNQIKCLENNRIEMFFDVSILEIKINDKDWYSTRVNFDKRIVLKQNKVETSNKKYIVCDVDETFINWWILLPNLKIIDKGEVPFNFTNYDSLSELVKIMGSLIKNFEKKCDEIMGISISISKLINGDTSQIFNDSDEHEINKRFENELSVYTSTTISVSKKLDLITLGEQFKGKLQNIKNAILISLFDSIDKTILVNNKILKINNDSIKSIRLMNVMDIRWDEWFSTKGLSKIVYERQNLRVKSEIIFKNLHGEFTNEINYWYLGLTKGINNLIRLFIPQIIIVYSSSTIFRQLNLSKIKELIGSYTNNEKISIYLTYESENSYLIGCIQQLNEKIEFKKHQNKLTY